MTGLPLGPPQPVSPLIRIVRFGLLVGGIFYGRSKQSLYNMREQAWREEEARMKIIRDKELAIQRARIAAEEKESVRLLESGKLFDTMDKK